MLALLNLVGAAPIQPAASISGVPLVPQTASTATVPRNAATALLRTGHQLYDRAGNRLWAIDSVEERPGDLTSFLVTLSGPSLPVAVNGSSISVEAGYFSRVVARAELITLPAGVNRDDLFLGQVVTGSVDNVFGQNTQITSIEAGAGGQTVIGLSRPVTLSAMTAVFLGEAARNVVNFNGDGIKITSGEVRIVATDVSNSVFDGIQIAGMKSGGIIEIGGVDGRTLSVSNASINSNGLAGIHVMESFFAGLATDSEKRARMNQLTIWGNFLGTDIESSAGKTNGTDGASNIVIGDPMIEQEFIARLDRGADGRYLATYRPEDDKVNPDLADFVDRDRNNNFHFTGDPVTLPGGAFGGGSYGDGGVVRLPTRR